MPNKSMRNGLLVLASIFMVLGMAGNATAYTSYFAGTVKIVIGDLEPAFITGSGTDGRALGPFAALPLPALPSIALGKYFTFFGTLLESFDNLPVLLISL